MQYLVQTKHFYFTLVLQTINLAPKLVLILITLPQLIWHPKQLFYICLVFYKIKKVFI